MAIDLTEGETVYLAGRREATVVAIDADLASDSVQICTDDDNTLHWVRSTDLTLEQLG